MKIYETTKYFQKLNKSVWQTIKALYQAKISVLEFTIVLVVLVWVILGVTDDREHYRKLYEEQKRTTESVHRDLLRIEEDAKKHKLEQEERNKQLLEKISQRAKTQVKVAIQPVRSGDCEQYRTLISQYPWPVEQAIKVCNYESGGNQYAANWKDNHKVCMGSFGIFQISCHSGQVYDPGQNVAIAYQKYQARGWNPWKNTAIKLGLL